MNTKNTTPPQAIVNFPYDENHFRKIISYMTYADICHISIEVWSEPSGVEILRSRVSPSKFTELEGEASRMIFIGPKPYVENLFSRVGVVA